MAFKFDRKKTSGRLTGNPPSYSEQWTASGSNNIAEVNAYALAATASVVVTQYGTLYRQDLQVQKRDHMIFDIEVPYGPRPNVTGDYSFDFDTSGATTNVKVSLGTTASYKAPDDEIDPPDHKGLIGVSGDKVEGTTQIIPALRLNVKFRHPLGTVTIPFARALSSYTATVNSDTFLHSAPGELLLAGTTGSDGRTADAEVTYRFLVSANADGLSFGDIVNVSKKGHEHAWISYKDVVDGGAPAQQPRYVYVERIYREIPFSVALGNWG